MVIDEPYMIVHMKNKAVVYGAAGRTAAEVWQMFEENECLGTITSKAVARRQGWRAKRVTIMVDA
jgi:hypothetical protein